MGKSGGGAKQRVTTYRMGIHLGLCAGPIDALKEIYVSEKAIGGVYADEQTEIDVDKPNLFGGIKKEGGVQGRITVLPGERDQLVTSAIAAKFGATPTSMEGFRGIASLFFSHSPGQPEGFYWIANSPYLRDIWAKVTRIPKDWYPEKASIISCGTGEEYTKRTISNIDLTAVNAYKSYDAYETVIAHRSADLNDLIIEDLRSGTVKATVTLGYTPLWVYISPSRNEVLTIDGAGTLYSYSAANGAAGSTVSGWGDPTPSGDPQGELCGTPTEIVIGSTTYLFFSLAANIGSMYIVCLSNNGGGWAHVWTQAQWSVIGRAPQVYAVSPTHIVGRNSFGGAMIAPWSTLALGDDTAIDFGTLLGWDVGGSDPVNSVTYLPSTGNWFFTARNGQVATLNSDCTAVVASDDDGGWAGVAHELPVRSRRSLSGSSSAVFLQSGTGGGVFTYNTAHAAQSDVTLVSEWGLNVDTIGSDSAYSVAENAIVTFDPIAGDGARVLFFPDTSVAEDANPIHMIVDSMTNRMWGMGGSMSQFNEPMWIAAADTIYDEGFGLSMIWTQQLKIEDFVGEILNHIEANVYINPRNGLFEIKLIRDDYDPDDLIVLDKSNSILIDHSLKLYGEGINEIVVTWTNPKNEKEETITLQDPGAIAIQGSIVSDNHNYYGIRCRSLATEACERDLRAATAPLASATVDVGRIGYDLTPGAVVKLNFPEHSLNNRIMRVGPVDYGQSKSAAIRLSLVEDVFSSPVMEFEEQDDGVFEDPREEPAPAAFTEIMTLPYYVAGKIVSSEASTGVTYPEVFAGVLAAQTGSDTTSFELYAEVPDSLGVLHWQSIGERQIVSRATLAAPLVAEAQTAYDYTDFASMTSGSGPTIAGLAYIGTGDDEDMEIVAVSSFSSPNYVLERGVLDTVPRAWPIGTPIWFAKTTTPIHDNTRRSAGEDVDYKVLPVTSLGILDEGDASVITETLNERPWQPLRPANAKLNSIGFGDIDARLVDPIPASWSNRNRLTEDSQILLWTAATVTPEVDQTTTIIVMDLDRNVLTTHSGLTGTTFDLPHASFDGHSFGIVRFESERGGLSSLQGHEFVVQVSSVTADTGAYTADTGMLTADNG